MTPMLAPLLAAVALQSPLHDRVGAELNHYFLRGAAVGVHVKALNGPEVFSKNPDRLLLPASVQKLPTCAMALDLFGPGWRPKTLYWRDGQSVALVGGGDPGLTVEDLERAAQRLGILGDEKALYDDGLFGPQRRHPNWEPADFPHSWCVPVSGLTVNRGRADLWAEAGRAWLEPRNFGVIVNGAPSLGSSGISFGRWEGSWTMNVRGSTSAEPKRVTAISLPDPAHCAARVFHPGAKRAVGLTPPSFGVVYEMSPRRMEELVRFCLRESDNHYAETLLRLCGVTFGASGSWNDSSALMSEYWVDRGFNRASFRFSDGSGLSRSNRLTARFLVALIEQELNGRNAAVFLDSLASPGVGTLERRLEGIRVWAKTGTMRAVSSLAGAVEGADGRMYVFAIMFNGYGGSAVTAREIQDEVVRALAGVSKGAQESVGN